MHGGESDGRWRVTVLYLWRVKGFGVLRAIHRMGFDRFFLHRTHDILFHKSLGTGSGKSFTPGDANPNVWGLLVVLDKEADLEKFDLSKVPRTWRKFAIAEKRIVMTPISSHGKWAGREPFQSDSSLRHEGKVAAITRARIKLRMNFLFWSSVPPVADSLHNQDGVEMAIGIGEAPIGLQGTFSIWRDAHVLRQFAYKGQPHASAIEATNLHQWYGEELFARFAVLEERGSI